MDRAVSTSCDCAFLIPEVGCRAAQTARILRPYSLTFSEHCSYNLISFFYHLALRKDMPLSGSFVSYAWDNLRDHATLSPHPTALHISISIPLSRSLTSCASTNLRIL